MNTIDKSLLWVVDSAQRLGLVAPFVLQEWSHWYAEASPRKKGPAVITVSSGLNTKNGRKRIRGNYSAIPSLDTSVRGVIAHEMGHAFYWHWAPCWMSDWPKSRSKDRRINPLKNCEELFAQEWCMSDPFDDVITYLMENPGEKLDRSQWLTWLSWADTEEDFADCFAEVVCRNGKIESYRNRHGVYAKLKFIRDAGRKILKSNPVLSLCNTKQWRYLFGGQDWVSCPKTRLPNGVPMVSGPYGGGLVKQGQRGDKGASKTGPL